MEYQEIDGIKGDLYHIYQEIENQPVFLYSFYVDNETGNIYAAVSYTHLDVYKRQMHYPPFFLWTMHWLWRLPSMNMQRH